MKCLAGLCVAAAVAISGCAATRVVYERLDWFAAWRLEDYVTLDQRQQAQFDRDFAALWRWHRAEQLPLYVQDLRQIAVQLDQPAAPQQVADYSERFKSHWESTMMRLAPPLCALVRTLDDEQAREILEGVDDNVEKFADEYVEPPEQELRRKSVKRVTRWITRWTGSLNVRQKEILRAWGGQRRNIGASWLDYRRRWRTGLEKALQQRASPKACAKLEQLVVRPLELRSAALRADLDFNDALWRRMIADILNAQDSKQREHTRAEVLEMAAQLEKLARTPP